LEEWASRLELAILKHHFIKEQKQVFVDAVDYGCKLEYGIEKAMQGVGCGGNVIISMNIPFIQK
jgi:hypothetical protein